MEKIKALLPLWLVLIFLGSAYFMFQNRKNNQVEYQQYVDAARKYVENGVQVDAIDHYRKALALLSSPALYTEAGEVFLTNGDFSGAKDWYERDFHAALPDEPETYEYGMRVARLEEDYEEIFQIYDECKERELVTDAIQKIIQPVAYAYEIWGDYADVRPYGNLSQVAAVQVEGGWGYVDIRRDRVLDYVYASAGIFGDLAAVVDQDGEAYFVDASGNKRITAQSILEKDPEFGEVRQFLGIESNKLWAYNGKIWNCYDAQTYQKLFGGYQNVTNFANGIAAVQNEEHKWALLAEDGTLVTEFAYDDVLRDQKEICCRTDTILAKQGGAYLLLNRQGQRQNDVSYEDAYPFYDSTYAAVKREGKWRLLDGAGAEKEMGDYEELRSYSNGYAAAKQNGKWGYLDQNGTMVLEPKFDDAAPFGPHGVAFVKVDGSETWGLLSLYKDNHD